MPACVYVLGNRRRTRSYVGVTSTHRLPTRLHEHNTGRGARYTRGDAWHIVTTVQTHARREALQLEYHIKHCTSRPGRTHFMSVVDRRIEMVRRALKHPRWAHRALVVVVSGHMSDHIPQEAAPIIE